MSKNRTVNQILELLSNKEKEQFTLYLKNSINSKQTKIYVLYENIRQRKTIEKFWAELFPDIDCPEDPYSSSIYRKLEFQLNSYLESFLAIQAFLKDKKARDLYFIKALNNRKAGKLFETKLKKTKSRLEKTKIRDESYFRTLYQLERQNQHFRYKLLLKAKGSIAPSLSKTFDAWWLHEKFRIAITNLNHERVTGNQINNPFFQEILNYVKGLSTEEYPVLHIYRVLYETLAEETAYQDIYTIIRSNKELFTEDGLKDIFATALNYYGRLVGKTKNRDYLATLFELYKWGISDRLVFKDEVLVWDHYKNFVTIGLHLEKYALTLKFIEDYKIYVPEDHRDEAYRFSLAHYYFTQANFKQVIKLLNLKFSNVYYEIQARLLVLQSHYELGSDADLLISLRSLRIFIGRQKEISANKKESEILRIKFFEKLVKAYNKKDFDMLHEHLTNSNEIRNQQWFLEKIENGKKSFRI